MLTMNEAGSYQLIPHVGRIMIVQTILAAMRTISAETESANRTIQFR